jgi:hypothetical protein
LSKYPAEQGQVLLIKELSSLNEAVGQAEQSVLAFEIRHFAQE